MPNARPRASNPGPRLALDAGTRTVVSILCERNLLAAPAGFVCRNYYFERTVTFFTRDERLAAFLARFAEVPELALEWLE
jgi:hypothetical protein